MAKPKCIAVQNPDWWKHEITQPKPTHKKSAVTKLSIKRMKKKGAR
jgi:hypothetical protein